MSLWDKLFEFHFADGKTEIQRAESLAQERVAECHPAVWEKKKSLETKNSEEMVEDGSMSLLLKDRSLEDQSEISLRILEGGRSQQQREGRNRCFCERQGWAWKGARPALVFHIGKLLSTFPWEPVSVNTSSSFVLQAWHPFFSYLYGVT